MSDQFINENRLASIKKFGESVGMTAKEQALVYACATDVMAQINTSTDLLQILRPELVGNRVQFIERILAVCLKGVQTMREIP